MVPAGLGVLRDARFGPVMVVFTHSARRRFVGVRDNRLAVTVVSNRRHRFRLILILHPEVGAFGN